MIAKLLTSMGLRRKMALPICRSVYNDGVADYLFAFSCSYMVRIPSESKEQTIRPVTTKQEITDAKQLKSDWKDLDLLKEFNQTGFTKFGEFPVDRLTSLISHTSCDETRYVLNGAACIKVGRKRELSTVATDGRRLVAHGEQCAPDYGPKRETTKGNTVIIETQVLKTMQAIAKANKAATVQIYRKRLKLRIQIGDVTIQCKGIDGNFPNYTQVITATDEIDGSIDLEKLKASILKVAKFSHLNRNGYKLYAHREGCWLRPDHDPEAKLPDYHLDYKPEGYNHDEIKCWKFYFVADAIDAGATALFTCKDVGPGFCKNDGQTIVIMTMRALSSELTIPSEELAKAQADAPASRKKPRTEKQKSTLIDSAALVAAIRAGMAAETKPVSVKKKRPAKKRAATKKRTTRKPVTKTKPAVSRKPKKGTKYSPENAKPIIFVICGAAENSKAAVKVRENFLEWHKGQKGFPNLNSAVKAFAAK